LRCDISNSDFGFSARLYLDLHLRLLRFSAGLQFDPRGSLIGIRSGSRAFVGPTMLLSLVLAAVKLVLTSLVLIASLSRVSILVSMTSTLLVLMVPVSVPIPCHRQVSGMRWRQCGRLQWIGGVRFEQKRSTEEERW
jgi:hypothetical protein